MLLKIYCYPGKLYANVQYLFPNGRVPVTATARRKDSTAAHFVFASAFYFLIFWLLLVFGFFHMPVFSSAENDEIQADSIVKNRSGYKIVSGENVMYLGNSCDFISVKYGSGHWSLNDGVVAVNADEDLKILLSKSDVIQSSC